MPYEDDRSDIRLSDLSQLVEMTESVYNPWLKATLFYINSSG